MSLSYRIDGLQYANWSERIFREMRIGEMDAVHVTIAYHENFRETVANIEKWNRLFERYSDLILHGKTADDITMFQNAPFPHELAIMPEDDWAYPLLTES